MKKLLILSVLLTSACNSTTMIHTSDPDARIYVNGEYLGVHNRFMKKGVNFAYTHGLATGSTALFA